MDRKLIAQWQGHQDGEQLILDTYTQVFGSDDEEYVRGQLAKMGGGSTAATMPVALPSGLAVAEPTSKAMKKGPSNHDAHSDHHSAGVAHPAPTAVNPCTKGNKVKTSCKGAKVEAEVTAVFKDEVQVRTPDGKLRWRTVRTVQPVIASPTPVPRCPARRGPRA